MSAETDTLIERLTAEARPVRRLRPPAVRALLWLASDGALLGAAIALIGMRPDFMAAMERPGAWVGWLASIGTGVAAAFAAFHLMLPDRSSRWALLPLPLALVWLASLGLGCYADWVRFGPDGIHLGDSFRCFLSIGVFSLLAGAPLLFMLRFAPLVRPVLTLALGGLAVASLASAAIETFHRHDARLMDIVWHVLAVLLVVTLSGSGGWAMRPRTKTGR